MVPFFIFHSCNRSTLEKSVLFLKNIQAMLFFSEQSRTNLFLASYRRTITMKHSPRSQPSFQFQVLDMQVVDYPVDFPRFLYEGPVAPTLFDQLEHFGQLHPVLVQKTTEDRYQVLSEYSYFSALKALGLEKISCQILPLSMPAAWVFSCRILHDSSHLRSPIMQAYLLQEASKALPEEEVLPLLPLMGHKPQRYKLKELTGLLRLEASAIFTMHQGILAQKIGKQLSLLHHEDQHHVIDLITTYRLGGSKQQKMVEMITELTLRHNKPVREIIQDWLPDTKNNNNMPQQLHGLLQYLYEQCYPSKTEAERKFKELMQELQPPKGITIAHSPSFEDESVEVLLTFNNAAIVKKNWERIKKIIQ
jgi:ParB family chromosome partitioning protein